MASASGSADIAVIGMSALFAKAANLQAYWQNICDRVDGISEADPAWSQSAYDPDSIENDRLCTNKGGFLHDLAHFQPAEFGIMPRAVDGGGPDQYLAIQLVKQALADAGYGQSLKPFKNDRTGVILGYGSYMNRGFANLLQHGLVIDQTLDLLRQIAPHLGETTLAEVRRGLKDSLPPFTPEMCPGLVPNNVTGRVANRLDLMGPNYVVDAACAASLISVHLGMEELVRHRCDLVIVGGVNASTPAPISMIFNQLGALTREQIRPFDAAASGTLLGEGLGILVLKRLAEAEAEGDRIYAVLKGTGSASDGKALSSVAPRLEGEALAIQRAYDETGIDPASIGLVEAHGTSIPLGDVTEIGSLTHVFGSRQGLLPSCALGSVKSMVAHCTTAAGAAGLIKTILALYHKVLPPTLCDQVNPDLHIEQTPFYINNQTRPWIHGDRQLPRRAAVNSFGFGGINAHAILEEYRGSTQVEQQLHSRWASELLVIAAPSRSALIARIHQLQRHLTLTPALADVAYSLGQAPSDRCRLAIVAKSAEDLQAKLAVATDKLTDLARDHFKTRSGIIYREIDREIDKTHQVGKTALLFPGEGAQYTHMLADLCLVFPSVRQWFDLLDEAFKGSPQPVPSSVIFPAPTGLTDAAHQFASEQLMGMDIGPAAVFVSSMALFELLQSFGVTGDAMVGHSSGENSALTASGMVTYEEKSQLIEKMGQFNQIIQEMEAKDLVKRGVLLAVGGIATDTVQQVIEPLGDRVQIAMDNCNNQVILFGEPAEMLVLHEQFKQQGGMCTVLPFDRAYHTPHFAEAGLALRCFYDTFSFQVGHTPVYSCASCARFPKDADAMRDLAAHQWAAPVRFRELVQQLYDEGFRQFVEVGPSGNLTAFVTDILRGQKDWLGIASNQRQKPGLENLQIMLGQLFTQGMDLDWQPFFQHRQVSALDFSADLSAVVIPKRFPFPTTLPVACLPEEMAQMLRDRLAPPPMRQNALATTDLTATDWPFLGDILEQTSERLVSDRTFTLTDDCFLQDHVFGGTLSQFQPDLKALPVIPLTFSLEMMAEAASCLVGTSYRVVSLHNLRAYRWIALETGSVNLRVEAQVQAEEKPVELSEQSVYVKLFQLGADAAGLLVFEGEVKLQNAYPAAPPAWEFTLSDPAQPSLKDADLYRTCMFHGPRLQGVKHLRQWSLNGIEADLEVLSTEHFHRSKGRLRCCLDPGLLDAAGQLLGYWISEQWGPADSYCFPFQIAALRQYADPLPVGSSVVCRSYIQFTSKHQLEASFDLLNEAGQVITRIEGWSDICYQVPRNNFYACRIRPQSEYLSVPWMQAETGTLCRLVAPFPEDFLETSWGIWQRMLAHLMLSQLEREIWYALPERGDRRTDWLLGRIAAKDALRQWAHQVLQIALAPVDIEIRPTPAGKPYASCAALPQQAWPDLSISHSEGYAIASVALEGQRLGIDIERRSPDLETMRFAFTEAETQLLQSFAPESQASAIQGLWCAKEAAAKAAGTGLQNTPQSWEITQYSPGFDQMIVTYGEASFSVSLWYTGEEVIAVCLL
ncbi:MAG: type I polyketide synthase [Phormidesmis priestleyi]|uniref:Type I polyketide synthase n=1 Tax=Phormidesmis priestleyi TaxID=268141 RepID=A0A2W4Z2P8_9CYAN|nr:MAG: type I polyketide synthase [Phormidesmis priestleyi]